MDRHKPLFKPRHLIICVTTCTIAALWAVLFAALYFYFWGSTPGVTISNDTDQRTVAHLDSLRLPWYLNGSLYPSVSYDDESLPLWPNQLPKDHPQRLRNQLMFLPKGSGDTKVVLFWSDWSTRELEEYKVSQCPVRSCVFTNSRKSFSKASAVVFRNPTRLLQDFPPEYRRRSQVWVFNSIQVPGESFIHPRDIFNWTATPRLDSDIPIFPHGVWMYFDPQWKQQIPPPNMVNQKDLGAAAWFPSPCSENTPSFRYVSKLLPHTSVDAYGAGPLCDNCPQNRTQLCHKLLEYKYRVTLVLQDQPCNNSIPDMFYLALQANTVPVVNSPSREYYEQLVPENSFIHTKDFASPRELAKHLETIYEDDNVFNSYLSWRSTGLFVKSWYCRLCVMLHHNSLSEMTIPDINQWWNPEGECGS